VSWYRSLKLPAELKVKMALVSSVSPSVSLGWLCGGRYYFLVEARVVDDHVVENDRGGGAATRPAATEGGAIAAVPAHGGNGRKREQSWLQ